MKKKIYILFSLFLILLSSILIWWNQATKPKNREDSQMIKFTISKGENARSIAERLQKAGLIRSSVAFFLLTRFGGFSEKIQAGDFRLNPAMDLFTLTDTLTHGTEDVWITIPEGFRNEEIALRLAKDLSVPESEFIKLAKEGYMFPDTYLVPKDSSAAALIKLFSDNFDKKISEEIRDKAKNLGLTLNDLIIIASLVEREAKLAQDRPLIASVILNRLKIGMKLDIDASVQYALGYQSAQKNWWKKDLSIEDLTFDSPYNTYKNPGLPPKPIANPGLSAIEAVVNAPNTDYLYYVADKTGQSHFARSIEEHNLNISKYLNK